MTDQARDCLGFFAFFLQFAGEGYGVSDAYDRSGSRPDEAPLRRIAGSRPKKGCRLESRSGPTAGFSTSKFAPTCAWSLVHDGGQYSRKGKMMSNSIVRIACARCPEMVNLSVLLPGPILLWVGPVGAAFPGGGRPGTGKHFLLLTRDFCVILHGGNGSPDRRVPHGMRWQRAPTAVAKSDNDARRME